MHTQAGLQQQQARSRYRNTAQRAQYRKGLTEHRTELGYASADGGRSPEVPRLTAAGLREYRRTDDEENDSQHEMEVGHGHAHCQDT